MDRALRGILLFTLLTALVVAAPVAAQDTGAADFTRFVALGDSLGAGFTSAGLVRGAQEDSVPALVARQATGRTIEQPLVSEPGLPPLLGLQGLSPLTIRPVAPPSGAGNPTNLGLPRPYDNLSVPGFDVGDALRNRDRPGTDLASLILRTPATQLEQALALQPTFALVWLGNNDVLAAATSGRVIEGVTLTPVSQFEADYTSLVGALRSRGVDLVLATLPDVTTIPFVTTIPPVVVDPQTSQPVTGPNGQPIPLLGPGGPLPARARVLLPASELLAQGIGIPAAVGGTNMPLPDEVVLSPSEIDTIRSRTQTFNAIIREVASQTGSALAEIGGLLSDARDGVNLGGIEFTTEFVTGGVISLDGVHPTPLGYAVAANEFIRAINDHYDARIAPVDLFRFLFGPDASAIPSIPGASVSELVYSQESWQQMLDVFGVRRPARGDRGDGGGAGGDAGGPADRGSHREVRLRR